jgi:uncharacterized membrane protein YphA (DoxX/SURF4 family)
MKTASSFKTKIIGTGNDSKTIIIRIIVGLIFISEGILKYKQIQWLGPGRFTELGFTNPFFWAYFTGAIEIVCGMLVLLGLFTRVASVPLLIIMLIALVTTKLPLIDTRGIWIFLHEYTTDFALTLLLILLFIRGSDRWSVDRMITR